jgi:hypothetical protein
VALSITFLGHARRWAFDAGTLVVMRCRALKASSVSYSILRLETLKNELSCLRLRLKLRCSNCRRSYSFRAKRCAARDKLVADNLGLKCSSLLISIRVPSGWVFTLGRMRCWLLVLADALISNGLRNKAELWFVSCLRLDLLRGIVSDVFRGVVLC